jgi:hypothetical protein
VTVKIAQPATRQRCRKTVGMQVNIHKTHPKIICKIYRLVKVTTLAKQVFSKNKAATISFLIWQISLSFCDGFLSWFYYFL